MVKRKNREGGGRQSLEETKWGSRLDVAAVKPKNEVPYVSTTKIKQTWARENRSNSAGQLGKRVKGSSCRGSKSGGGASFGVPMIKKSPVRKKTSGGRRKVYSPEKEI